MPVSRVRCARSRFRCARRQGDSPDITDSYLLYPAPRRAQYPYARRLVAPT
ncbi:hypothetical protein [Streptomyces sp. KMM 9044]|uniref:hypothetical protein n=1 Tax=Streptomyces sp. KMM 9044 TaxID=2744474 RepID=UPI002151D260|nr:hypothetical protein [Streptomyces sp. KMM 9044]WAX81242.1 hypothetical protein HUV60_029910 [Streptomyces sp. KMM 9044]